jgi:isocitrate dehydrogenase
MLNEDHQLYIAIIGIICFSGLEIAAIMKGLDGQYFGVIVAAISGIVGLMFGIRIGAQTKEDSSPKVKI